MRFLTIPIFAISMLFASNAVFIPDTCSLENLNPDMSDRQTAKICLENGLEVYLISDPKVDESAASLSVEAGSFQEWTGYDGIAHFTEHLLFLGSETYPDEHGFHQFVNDHKGVSNAYTASDCTVYAFKCTHDGFSSAADQFAHFFIDPLFNESGIKRELNAVDQEYTKNLESDEWREWMVVKEVSNPNHPISKFSTGNSETLGGIPREKVMEWYRTHYSADRMHLVLISNKPLDQMIALAEDSFSKIPVTSAIPVADSPMFTSKQKGHIVYLQPVRDLRKLNLYWEIKPDLEYKSELMISRLLNAKTEGSLYAQLKREGLIEEVHAGGDVLSKENSLFAVEIHLTREGVAQKDRVLDLTFAYLSHISRNAYPTYIYNEMHKMRVWNYAFASRGDTFNTAMSHAHSLVHFPIASYPENQLLPKAFNPKAYSSRMQELKADECMVVLMAPSELTGLYPEHREQWNGGAYSMRKLPKERTDDLNEIVLSNTFDLPAPSTYIPTKLTPSCEKSSNETPSPQLVVNEDFGKLYHFQDRRFCTPKVALTYRIKSAAVGTDAFTQALLDLYLYAVDEATASEGALAAQAGLYGSLSRSESSLVLSIDGYQQKAPELLKTYLNSMKNLDVSAEQFKLYYDALYSYYESGTKAPPFRQALDSYQHIILNDFHPTGNMLSALKEINYNDFVTFKKRVVNSVYIEAISTGSLSEQGAISHFELVKKSLGATPFPVSDHQPRSILSLQDDTDPVQVNFQSPMQGNACLLAIETLPFTHQNSATHSVLTSALSSDFFDELRTKQQTGYIVHSAGMDKRGKLIILFLSQSGTHNSGELIARFELFLEEYTKNLGEKISKDRFEKLRSASIESASQPPRNLSDSASLYFTLAFEKRADFQFKEKRIEALEMLTYEQFLASTTSYLSRSNGKRMAILVEGKNASEGAFRYQRTSQDMLKQNGLYIAYD